MAHICVGQHFRGKLFVTFLLMKTHVGVFIFHKFREFEGIHKNSLHKTPAIVEIILQMPSNSRNL